MSIQLRLKYQYRSFCRFFVGLQLPPWLNSFATRLVLVVLIAGLGGAYVFEVSALTTSGFALEQLEEKISALATEERALATRLAEAESLTHLTARLSAVGMVPAERVSYLKNVGSVAVAER